MDCARIVVGNWKMNKLPKEGSSFVEESVNLLLDVERVQVIFCPPFTGLLGMNLEHPFSLGSQNCHWEGQGAFTGEISTMMLKDCGVSYVIVGHSERRQIFFETNDWIKWKMGAVVDAGLIPIFCIGETLEQRKSGQTDQVLAQQLQDGFKMVNSFKKMVIAYEPVWAIGTGISAKVDQVKDAHLQIKNILSKQFPKNILTDFPILYGGSVTPDNAEELISVPGVDGFLIGGASLNIDSFTSIVRTVDKN
tara:strand:- start:1338 stop:2087 length:750 start_codon:yes stop_codon:yes gene_type:complete